MPKLIIVRHAQSILNQRGVFSGKLDTPLSFEGVVQAHSMSEQLINEAIEVVFTSSLFRAQETAAILTEVYCKKHGDLYPVFMNSDDVNDNNSILPILSDDRLDERSYGILEGVDKKSALEMYGQETIHSWRRGWDASPQGGESLKQVCNRVQSFIADKVVPAIMNNQNILVICHQNSMRAFSIILENINTEAVEQIEFNNGEYLKYEYRKNKWRHIT